MDLLGIKDKDLRDIATDGGRLHQRTRRETSKRQVKEAAWGPKSRRDGAKPASPTKHLRSRRAVSTTEVRTSAYNSDSSTEENLDSKFPRAPRPERVDKVYHEQISRQSAFQHSRGSSPDVLSQDPREDEPSRQALIAKKYCLRPKVSGHKAAEFVKPAFNEDRNKPPEQLSERFASFNLQTKTSTRRQNHRKKQLIDFNLSIQASDQLRREFDEAEARAAEEEKQRRREEEERERRAYRLAPSHPVIAPLSPQWKSQLNEAMKKDYARCLARAPDGTEITRRDLGTLYPQSGTQDDASGWLNDEIINTYMKHIVEFGLARVEHKRNETPRFHNFPSQFYQNLSSKGPQSVARWAKRAKIGGEKLQEVDMVFIPCNPGVHWTMLIVHPKRQLVEYFDSFHGKPDAFLEIAAAWLNMELPGFVREEWKFRKGIGPRQTNSSDCGVFAITTAKMVMLGIDPEKAYTEKDLQLQRKRIACELMIGGFKGEFAPREDDIFNECLKKPTLELPSNGNEARL